MKKIIFIILVLSSFRLFSQSIDTINLWQCISDGVENFNVQKSLDFSNKSVNLQQENLKSNFYPVLKLEGQATYQSSSIEIDIPIPGVEMPTVPLDQYKAYLEINQLIYDGGLTKSYENILNLSLDENVAKTTITENQIKNNIAKIFFLAILVEKQADIIENQLKTLNEQLKVIETGIRNEVLTPVNKNIMLSEILKIEQKLDETNNLKSSTLNILEYYTGQTITSQAKFIFPNIIINANDTTVSPRVNLLDIQSQKTELLTKQLEASRRPHIYAFAQGGYGRPGLNMLSDEFSPYFIGGVTFSWRICDWNNTKRNKQIYSIKNQQISIENENLQINIKIQKENILTKIKSTKEAIKKDEQIIELQHKILKTYNAQLKQGIITSSEFVIEVNKLSQAQLTLELHNIQLEQLKFEYNNIY